MKLVVTYTTSGSCDYYDHVVCIEYESGEALLADLEEEAKKYLEKPWKERGSHQLFTNSQLYIDHFIERDLYESGKERYYPPTVRTLEEWWEQNVNSN